MRFQRLSPPELPRDGGLDWVLQRAFGPVSSVTQRVMGGSALLWAQRLALGERLAHRVPEAQLAAEVGTEGARQLAFRRLACLAADDFVQRAQQRVLVAATGPVVLLKHAALRSAGYVERGSRDARDLDVLVDPDVATTLQAQLRADGFTDEGFAATDQHLPALRSTRGEAVELHTSLFGLVLPSGAAVSASALVAGEHVEGCPIDVGSAWVPGRSLLCAHVLVHGLVQHLTSVEDYPLSRVLADLVDLEFSEADLDEVCAWTTTLSRRECAAAAGLTAHLRAGTRAQAGADSDLLLRHVVASAHDREYRRHLRRWRLTTLVRDGRWLPALRRALIPSAADVAAHYGEVESPWLRFALSRTHVLRRLSAVLSDWVRR